MKNDKKRERDEMIDDSTKFIEILTQHLLVCGDDLTLLTLKGHLVVEYLLEMILLRLLGIPEAPKRRGRRKTNDKIMPGFYEKLKLVEAVVCQRPPGPNADLLIVIDELNWMRNQLVHNLKNPADIESDVKSLIESYHRRAGTKPDPNQDLPKLLSSCLVRLCQFLHSVRSHF